MIRVGVSDMLAVMNTKSERLRQARVAAGFTSTQAAADRLGVSPSTYRAHENGQNDFNEEQAKVYAKAFSVTPEHLILGTPLRPAQPFSTFDPDAPEPVADPDAGMTVGEETGVRGIPDGSTPQIDVTAGMGGGGLTVISEGVPGKRGMTFAAENISDFWRVPPGMLIAMGGVRPTDIAFIPVQGDSMYPTLTEGDVVVVDTRHRWPSPDGIYALNDAFGGVIVKRLEVTSKPGDEEARVDVISDNPRHPTKNWGLDELRIVGRVLRKFGMVT